MNYIICTTKAVNYILNLLPKLFRFSSRTVSLQKYLLLVYDDRKALLYSKTDDSERLILCFSNNNILITICYSNKNNKCPRDAFTLSIGRVSKSALRSTTLFIHVQKTSAIISGCCCLCSICP